MWLAKRAQKNPEKRLKLGLNVQKGKQWQKFPFVVVFKKNNNNDTATILQICKMEGEQEIPPLNN